jgi:hypothetical protein
MLTSAAIVLIAVALIVGIPVLFFRRGVLGVSRRFAWLGILLVVAGGSLVVTSFLLLGNSAARRHWPMVQGEVLHTQVAGTRAFHPEIVYSYTVNNQKYSDTTAMDSPAFGGRNNKYDVARKIVAEYPTGKAVSVYYDPTDPSISTLRPFAPWNLFGQVSFGSIVFGGGMFLIAAYLASRRRIPSKI